MDNKPYSLKQMKVISEIGHPKLQKKVLGHLTSKSSKARNEYAKFTTNKKHLDKLLHDSSPNVRCSVAQHQCISHLNHLVYDPVAKVRQTVAKYGAPSHSLQLLKDKKVEVRNEARKNLDYYRGNDDAKQEWLDAPEDEVQSYQEWPD